MPEPLAGEFGALLGADLRGVRCHDDAQAAEQARTLAARAYTQDEHIYFAADAPKADTEAGRRLLGHELIHTVQQRRGEAAGKTRLTGHEDPSEVEARRGADMLMRGQPFHPAHAAGGLLQREDNASAAAATPGTSMVPQLQLDPALQAQMRAFMASWLASQWGGGSVTSPLTKLTLPSLGSGGAAASSASGGPVSTTLPPALKLTPPSFSSLGSTPSTPNYFAPIPPDPTYRPPDYSSVYGPYNDRGMAPAGRADSGTVDSLYGQRWKLVSMLPDLRSMAPGPLRSLIPTTWRVDLASALTGLTIDSSLSAAAPTAVEAADAALVKMTGNKDAAPTYINPPFPPFKWSF